MSTNNFEKLEVWKEAHNLTISVYKITKRFPVSEKFRLVDQICRSSSSVVANVVEGNSRGHKKEFLQFLYQSRGSLEETKYHLLLARDLGYLSEQIHLDLSVQAEKVGRLLGGLIRYLKT